MRNVIQITDNILGVIVDEKYTRFMIDEIDFYQGQFLFAAKEKGSYCVIKSFDDKHKIHGTCTLQAFDFDFEVDESWVEKKKFNKGVFIEDTYLYRDYLSSNENMCFVGLPEYECRVKSFKSKIQKAIQDEGMFVVNPVKLMDGKNISCEEEAEAYHKNMTAFVEAETKTVKKLLLIEKI